MLARVRGVEIDQIEEVYYGRHEIRGHARRSPSGRRSTRTSCWPSTRSADRFSSSVPRRIVCSIRSGSRAHRLRSASSGPRLESCSATSRPSSSARRWRSRRPARGSDEKTLSQSTKEAAGPATAASLSGWWIPGPAELVSGFRARHVYDLIFPTFAVVIGGRSSMRPARGLSWPWGS